MSASVVAIHLSTASRAPLRAVASANAVLETGLEGDRHAKRNNRRSVLLVEQEVLEPFGLAPGEVREQVTVRGLGLMKLVFGSRLRVGGAVFEVAGACAPCARKDDLKLGLKDELDGRRGRFVRVVQAGAIQVGDAITVEPPVAVPAR